jgi:hypothetical protein
MRVALFSPPGGTKPVISYSTLLRHLHLKDRAHESDECRPYSFKRLTLRGPEANSPENKNIRILVANLLLNSERNGYLSVHVDESHWEILPNRSYGWSEVGEAAMETVQKISYTICTICAISRHGMEYTELIIGTVHAALYGSYLKRLMFHMKEEQRGNLNFYMDNANIHDGEVFFLFYFIFFFILLYSPFSSFFFLFFCKIRKIVEEANHTYTFSAAYSLSLNPIGVDLCF